MNNQVLTALVDSLDRRESVALVSITDAIGSFAEHTGRNCALWLDRDRPPVGDLGLGALTEQVYHDARQALFDRKHRHLDYQAADEQGTESTVKVFVEVQAQPPHLIIVGAGHIAVPLAAIAKINEFEVTVLDDRPQYAHSARFPAADRVIAGPFRAELNNLRPDAPDGSKRPFDNHTYVVLVTRGHQYDIDSLLEVLDDPLAYVGMIGSQRRIRAVFELLEKEQGIPAHKFDRIHAPIGIDIGARTPAEIGVCIMAEIINVLRDGPAETMSAQIRRERLERRERHQAG